MFKEKKAVAIVMATMSGVSEIGGSMLRNDVRSVSDNSVARAVILGKNVVIIKQILIGGSSTNNEYLGCSVLFHAYNTYGDSKERYRVMEVLLKYKVTLKAYERILTLAGIIANGDYNIKNLLKQYGITFTPEEQEKARQKGFELRARDESYEGILNEFDFSEERFIRIAEKFTEIYKEL